MNTELEISLVTKINETYSESVALASNAKETAKAAIQKAVECGQYLIEAKQSVGHGGWTDWFLSHVTGFSIETAYRYMRLAQASRDELSDAYSMRNAYILTGILDKPGNAKQGENHDPDGVNWINVLSKMTVQIERLFDTRPISAWDDVERETFIERSKPIVKRFVQAGGNLTNL